MFFGKLILNSGSNNKLLERFLLTLIILGIFLNIFKNRLYDNCWTVGEWLISYSGSFIRKGRKVRRVFFKHIYDTVENNRILILPSLLVVFGSPISFTSTIFISYYIASF